MSRGGRIYNQLQVLRACCLYLLIGKAYFFFNTSGCCEEDPIFWNLIGSNNQEHKNAKEKLFQEAISTMRENQNLASKQTLKVRTEDRCDSNLTLEPREGQKQGEEAEREVLEHNIS